MIILNALFPIFVLLALGSLLKRLNFTTTSFLQISDRLVYNIFFPLMLFYKIGGAQQGAAGQWPFVLVSLLVVVFMQVLSTGVILFLPVPAYQAGTFSQSCYRFNTYIGVAVVLNSLGETGIAYFGVLIALAIPLINVYAVSVLVWFSGEGGGLRRRSLSAARSVVINPLIIGCFLGIVYARFWGAFPSFIDNTLQLLSMVTLPLALLSIGGSLTFRGLHRHLPLSLLAAFLKLVVMPASGFALYRLFGIDGIGLQAGMMFLCLPASTAIYVLSSQLKSDTELASASIFVSTVLSFGSLSVALLL